MAQYRRNKAKCYKIMLLINPDNLFLSTGFDIQYTYNVNKFISEYDGFAFFEIFAIIKFIPESDGISKYWQEKKVSVTGYCSTNETSERDSKLWKRTNLVNWRFDITISHMKGLNFKIFKWLCSFCYNLQNVYSYNWAANSSFFIHKE